MMPRRWISLTALVLLLAFAALSAYWWWSAARLEAWVTLWAEEQQQRGYQVSYQGPEVGGYPLRLRARLTDVRLASPGGGAWQAPLVTAEALLLNPLQIDLSFPGRHLIEAPEGRPQREIVAELTRAAATIHLKSDGQLDWGTVRLVDGVIFADGQEALQFDRLTAQLGPLLPASGDRLQSLTATFSLDTASTLRLANHPFGSEIARFAAELELLGPLPQAEPRTALQIWREAGGRLDIATVEINWGPLEVKGLGSLGLDADNRLAGKLDTRISGLAESLAAASNAGLIERQQATTLAVGLTAFASEQDASGRPVVVLPIEFKQGYLYLGPLPLAPLSPVL